MTSPPVKGAFTCPACATCFEAWWRPSINTSLGEAWTAAEIEDATTVVCPGCAARLDPGALLVDERWRP